MDILENIEASLSPAQINALSDQLGESPDATEKAMTGAIPAILGGVAQQASTQQGAARLIETMKGLPRSGSLTDLLATGGNGLQRTGQGVVSQLFNGQTSSIASLISNYSGMKTGSVQNLMAMSAPLVLGGIAREAPVGGFSPQGLMKLLDGQKSAILRSIPAGLSGLAGLVGLGGFNRTAQPAYNAQTQYTAPGSTTTVRTADTWKARRAYTDGTTTTERVDGGVRWLPWLVGLIALGALAMFGLRTCAHQASAPMHLTTLTLPGGGTIGVRAGSIGDQLFKYLSGAAPTPQAFTFDYLDFNSGDANYTASSQPTIDSIGAILKSYPNSTVRIEGFTDSQGDEGSNLRLSQARADTVARAIVATGVDSSRVTAAGLGEARPIADNATEAGRAKNRRIELVVTQK